MAETRSCVRVRTSVLAAAMVALSAGTMNAAVPTEWTYTIVARTGASFQALNVPGNSTFAESGIPHEIGLDESGNVALRVVTDAGLSSRRESFIVYDRASQSVSTPVQVIYNTSIYSERLDLRSGKLALTKAGLLGSGEVRDTSGAIDTPIDLGGPLQLYGQLSPMRILDAGGVAYRGSAATSPTNPSSTIKIVVDRMVDGQREQVALADCLAAGPYVYISPPAISATGFIAARFDLRDSNTRRIDRIREGEPTVTIATISGNIDSLAEPVAVSRDGEVAYFARSASNFAWSLLRSDGLGNATTIATAAQFPATGINNTLSIYTPAINSAGQVAYRAELTGGGPIGAGLFIADGSSTFRLAGEGKTLRLPSGQILTMGYGNTAGSKIALMGSPAINDRGDVAFVARFSDNTMGLVLASPVILRCSPADIADDTGAPLPSPNVNNGVTEGDYNLFFASFFDALPVCDIANDDGSPLAPFGITGVNNGVTEGDYNLFFSTYFDGCQ